MRDNLYCVWFVDVGIKFHVVAILGEIAISKAEKELKQIYGDDLKLGNKVNCEVIGYASI